MDLEVLTPPLCEIGDGVRLTEVEPARFRRDRVGHGADLGGQRTELPAGDLLVAGIVRGERRSVRRADRLLVTRHQLAQWR